MYKYRIVQQTTILNGSTITSRHTCPYSHWRKPSCPDPEGLHNVELVKHVITNRPQDIIKVTESNFFTPSIGIEFYSHEEGYTINIEQALTLSMMHNRFDEICRFETDRELSDKDIETNENLLGRNIVGILKEGDVSTIYITSDTNTVSNVHITSWISATANMIVEWAKGTKRLINTSTDEYNMYSEKIEEDMY